MRNGGCERIDVELAKVERPRNRRRNDGAASVLQEKRGQRRSPMLQTVSTIRTLQLPSGRAIPALGQGTVRMGDDPHKREGEVAALRFGLDLGAVLIDTRSRSGGAKGYIPRPPTTPRKPKNK